MRISFSVLIYDGQSYSRRNPGIAIVDYADFLNWKEERTEQFWDRVREHFENSAHIEFLYDISSLTTIKEILDEIILRMNFDKESILNAATQTYILAEGEFVLIRKPTVHIGDIEKYYDLKDQLYIFLVLSNQAGTIWNEDGLRYYMKSRESGSHHVPHVHVDYKHKKSASISLIDGSVLVGQLPSKVLKKVKAKVKENQNDLLEYWEKNTDGFCVNINCSFGITPLQISE